MAWSTGAWGDIISALTGFGKGVDEERTAKENRAQQMKLAENKGVVAQVIQELKNSGAIDKALISDTGATTRAGIGAKARTDAATIGADARRDVAGTSAGVGYDRNATMESIADKNRDEKSGEFWGQTAPYEWGKLDLGQQQERGRNARNATTNATMRRDTDVRAQLGERGQNIAQQGKALSYAMSAYNAEMKRRKQNDPLNFNEDEMPSFEDWVQTTDDPEVFPSLKKALTPKPSIFQDGSAAANGGAPGASANAAAPPAGGAPPATPTAGPVRAAGAPRVIDAATLKQLAADWGLSEQEARTRATARGIVVR